MINILFLMLYFHALASSRIEISSTSSFKAAALVRSFNCFKLVTLAIGEVTEGLAISQAIATLAREALYCSETSSSAFKF